MFQFARALRYRAEGVITLTDPSWGIHACLVLATSPGSFLRARLHGRLELHDFYHYLIPTQFIELDNHDL